MINIILDTNFLLIPARFKVDIFSEIDRIMTEPYRLCIVKGTIEELNKITVKESGKEKQAAKLTLALIKQKSLYTLENSQGGSVDDIIFMASEGNTVVATQDKGLKERLKKKHIRIITLREKSYLELI